MHIIKNYELKIKNLRSGYTIIEMVVVMGIIAILMTLGATGFASYRSQAAVDAAAEELAAMIRKAQTNSVAVNDGVKPHIPSRDLPELPDEDCHVRAWNASIRKNIPTNEYIISLYGLYLCEGDGTYDALPNLVSFEQPRSNIDMNGIKVSGIYTDGINTSGFPDRSFNIFYSTPFARAMSTQFDESVASFNFTHPKEWLNRCELPMSMNGCWYENINTPAKEWFYKNNDGSDIAIDYFSKLSPLGRNYHLEVTLEKGSASKKVLVYSNGDVEIK